MNGHLTPDDRERLDELLAGRAFGLEPSELQELDRLLGQIPGADSEEFDRILAALDLGLALRDGVALPEHLRERCVQQARTALLPSISPGEASTPRLADAAPRPPRPWLPWAVAAACLIAAVASWTRRPATISPPEVTTTTIRDEVLADREALKVRLNGLDPGSGQSGELVWSHRLQRGFMRFQGLAANDRTRMQYQLWIFDRSQDERYPIDGGVFDVGSQGESLVPIRAAIGVADPYQFAITEEKPGGVVVSDRDPIVLIGQLETAK